MEREREKKVEEYEAWPSLAVGLVGRRLDSNQHAAVSISHFNSLERCVLIFNVGYQLLSDCQCFSELDLNRRLELGEKQDTKLF